MWNDEYTAVNLEIFATQNVTEFTTMHKVTISQ